MFAFWRRNPARGRRFTLVEMLVVVTIIAVLAALLLPSLQMALESSRGMRCISNLKQLGIAAQTYAGEYANGLPHSINSSGQEWSWVLQGYGLDGREMYGRWSSPYYECPTADNAGNDTNSAYPHHRNYACNNMVFTHYADSQPLHAGAVRRPSQVAMLLDAPFYGEAYGCWYRIEPSGTPYFAWSTLSDADWNAPVPAGEDSKTPGRPNSILYRHSGGMAASAVHVDGSAKAYPLYTFLKNNVFPFR